MGRYGDDGWRPYVPVAARRRRAAGKLASMKKAGRDVSPVEIKGRKIATTFWGEAWCSNLEAYSDFENRLPRGRTYARNGSVIDLQIEAGRVRSLVSGSDLYTVEIDIKSLARKRWKEIKGRCAGQIDSLVELLQGSISASVMAVVTRKGEGLFPSPREITLDCSCPDWATVCKHVAASLYGVGARLDQRPELLFTLRGVDPVELVETAVDQGVNARKPARGRVLEAGALSSVFGVDIGMDQVSPDGEATSTRQTRTTRRRSRARKSAASGGKTKAAASSTRSAAARKKRPTKKAAGKKASARPSAATEVTSKTPKKRKAKRTTQRKASVAKKKATRKPRR